MSGGRYVELGWIYLPEEVGEAPALVGAICLGCREVFFPPKAACPNCWSREFEKIIVGRKGTLNNFTVSHVAPKGFRAPYVQAFIDLEEGPRVFSQIDIEVSEIHRLKNGDPMELVIQEVAKDEAGQPIIAWKYRPVNKIGNPED